MSDTKVKLWYDQEGDYMEVIWDTKPGYFTATEDDRVMVMVDTEGNVQGFHILGVRSVKGKPFDVTLAAKPASGTGG